MSATITKYYSFDYILSHNAVYNFVVGARGLGKTYGAKRKAIKAFLKRGDQFVYTRRYVLPAYAGVSPNGSFRHFLRRGPPRLRGGEPTNSLNGSSVSMVSPLSVLLAQHAVKRNETGRRLGILWHYPKHKRSNQYRSRR